MFTLGIFIHKMNFIKLILLGVLLFESIQTRSGDAVLVKFQNQLDPSKQLTICALKKPFTNDDVNTPYPLVYIKPALPCSKKFVNSSINGGVEFIKLDQTLQCKFSDFVEKMQANNPKLVLVGSDGPFVIKQNKSIDVNSCK